MAIVELRGMVYVGRLFFGHEDTGEVLWDCDCRPSDGFWLALMVWAVSLCAAALTICLGICI